MGHCSRGLKYEYRPTMNTESTSIIELRQLRFAYGGAPVPVLDIAGFNMRSGERVFLHGASGSGKSTLLGLLGGVLEPQQGTLAVLGRELRQLRAAQRDQLRADHIGFIFQMFNLLPYLSVVDNVLLSVRFSASRAARALQRSPSLEAEARRLLRALGLEDEALLQRNSAQLSQGQQQRVAAARALLGNPSLIIADEPTSSLDADARGHFLALLLKECAHSGAAVLFVSHDRSLSAHFDRSVAMQDINQNISPAVTQAAVHV